VTTRKGGFGELREISPIGFKALKAWRAILKDQME